MDNAAAEIRTGRIQKNSLLNSLFSGNSIPVCSRRRAGKGGPGETDRKLR